MKKRRDNLESIGKVVKEVVEKYGLRKGMDESRIKELWEEFLGAELRYQTSWIRLREGVLFAQMKDAVSRHEVFMQRTALRLFINVQLGEEKIREIRLL